MNTFYYISVKNTILPFKPSKAILAFLIFNFFLLNTAFGQNGPNCPTGVCIGPGGPFTSGSLTISSNAFYSNIIVKNGASLTVKSGFTLYVGQTGTAANTQVVDFQNGSTVIVEAGASLVVNGLLNNSNNSNGVTFNGSVAVTGNVTAGSGSTIVGSGTLNTTGTITTNNSGSIFGSTGDCTSGPCSGTTMDCSGLTNTISGNQTICSGNTPTPLTGSTIFISATYQWQQSTTNGANFVNISGATSANYSPGPMLTTTYYRRTQIVGGCVGTSSQIVISVNTTNTWTGATNASWFTPTNWSCGSVPNAASDVVIPNVIRTPIVDVSSIVALANTLTAASGSSLIVNSNNTLKVTDKVTNNGGTITFEDSASLVQINNVSNTGNIKYLRRTNTTVISTDYTYWSSPVSGQTMYNLSLNTLPSMFYSYQVNALDENWQQESSGIAMAQGVGYSIGGPKIITPPSTYLATFIGVPNNGTITLSNIFANKSYLLGNPYPSAIDADTFLNQNAAVLGGTLYFWTHNTNLQDKNNISSTAGSGDLAYTSDDYATYNITGGVGIDPGSSTSSATNPGENTAIPSGKIAAGQGFFASSKAFIPAGSLIVFNNNIRLAGEEAGVKTNTQFFKIKNSVSKTMNTIEKHRVWLSLTNNQGAFKQTLVGYITDATNEFDSRFDGESFDGNEFVDFYSINQDKNLVIQGRALPFDKDDEVPLGFRTTIKGDFTINIAQVDGLLNNQNVFIEDKLMNKTANLKEGNYTFNTTAGTFDDRFVLRYSDKTLATTDFNAKENNVQVSIKNKKMQIKSFSITIDEVAIFDMLGKKIYQKNKVNSNELSTSDFMSSDQTLLVKTTLQNGKTATNKIIY